MQRLDGKRTRAESREVTEQESNRVAERVFREIDLPGMLRETGLSVMEVSVKTGLSRTSVHRIMGKGAGSHGEWSNGLRLGTIAKYLVLCEKEMVIGVRDLTKDNPSEPLYVHHKKYFMITPGYGPVTIRATEAHLNKQKCDRKWVGTVQEFPTLAHAFYGQKLLPEYWAMAGRYKDLGRLVLKTKQVPKDWMVSNFSPGFAMRTGYVSAFKEVPEMYKILAETGDRELIWESPKKKHELFHEMGFCSKCKAGVNVAGQILMELREEL